MNPYTGEIYTPEQVDKLSKDMQKKLVPMKVEPTEEQLKSGKVGRNDTCPCGSKLKFKHCCQRKAQDGEG